MIDKLKELDLPSNARGFKADANKMYTSIDIEHGLEVLRQFLEELKQEGNLPVYLGELLSQDVQDGGLGIDRTIVAFHRPPNLRDLLQSSRLRQVQGSEVSTYFGG